MGLHVLEREGNSQLGVLSLDLTFVFIKSGKLAWKDSPGKELEVTAFPRDLTLISPHFCVWIILVKPRKGRGKKQNLTVLC